MKYIFKLVISLFSFSVCAQTSVVNLSITQAIDLGLKNRYDVQAHKYNIDLANNTISKSKKEWVPDLSGSGRMAYNPQIQATYIPAGFFGPKPELIALGANSSAVFGLDLNQNLYKPTLVTDTKIARNKMELEKEINKQEENTIREQIAFSYLNVLLKKLQIKVSSDDEQRYKEYAQVAEGKLKLNALIENDYLKAQLDYENSKVETIKAKQNYDLAMENIKFQINIPVETVLTLTDSINSPALAMDQTLTKSDVNNRTEIKQLALQQQGLGLELTKNRQNALPTVSFFANYSTQFQYTNFDYTQSQWWSPFNYIGIHLNVPITSNFKNDNNIQEYKIKSLQTDLVMKQKTTDIAYEIQSASTELSNALKNMNAMKDNYNLSRIIYENQKLQYNIGTLLYSNLLDTDKSLLTTEENYVKAVYDYLLASINYQRAIGAF